MSLMAKTFRLDEFGLEAEIGGVARQADGAVMLKRGGTVLLSTVVAAPSKEFPGFLPLLIDYREQYAAAGKIPGGYFKREGKPSDREVLIGRLVDRAVRPLFPENYFDQVQIISTVYSVDKEHGPRTMALIGSSIALSISQIPFLDPVAAVEVSRVDGKWVIDPLYQESRASDVSIVVAGTEEGINMVEGAAKGISEQELMEVLLLAHDAIKKIVAWQKEIQREIGKQKAEIADPYGWDQLTGKAAQYLTEARVQKTYIEDKTARNAYMDSMRTEFVTQNAAEIEEKKIPAKLVEYIFDSVFKEEFTELVFKHAKRVDGRAFDEVRAIDIKVGLLPFTHGSALFTRGSTQALVTLTLGGGDDTQKLDAIMEAESEESRFMLHYNFPPFSVGEVRPMRGTGRREVGHGHLAASSFKFVLPDREKFPYTIRLVSDILESNGSSSMATVCGSTMALMQGGVPITAMIGGVAMGLLINKKGDYEVLTDISGFEDNFGMMDFKVAGTDNGISAIQMDIKYKGGLKREVFVNALKQAREGRLHILGEMKKVMSKPNAELSYLVPKVNTVKIDPDKIGAIIGSGGKTIREIIAVTGTKIDVEPDGKVNIYGGPDAKIDLAIHWVKTLAGQIEIGSVFTGIIRRIAEFGLFVELVPGIDGLVHVSNIPKQFSRNFGTVYKNGDEVTVKVLDHDESTGRTSLRIISEQQPDQKSDRKSEDNY